MNHWMHGHAVAALLAAVGDRSTQRGHSARPSRTVLSTLRCPSGSTFRTVGKREKAAFGRGRDSNLRAPSDAPSRRPLAQACKEARNSSSLLRLIALETATTRPKHQRHELEKRAWPAQGFNLSSPAEWCSLFCRTRGGVRNVGLDRGEPRRFANGCDQFSEEINRHCRRSWPIVMVIPHLRPISRFHEGD
jgi:hypothetical protein